MEDIIEEDDNHANWNSIQEVKFKKHLVETKKITAAAHMGFFLSAGDKAGRNSGHQMSPIVLLRPWIALANYQPSRIETSAVNEDISSPY